MKKILILLPIFCSVFCFAQKEKLGFNLTKGNTYSMTTEAVSNIKQQIQGQEISIGMTILGTTDFTVAEKTETGYVMQVKYGTLGMKMNMFGTEKEFSSSINDPNDIFSSMLKKLTGHVFTMTMSRSGEIKEVKGIEAAMDKMVLEAQHLPAEQRAQIKEQLMQGFGEKAFKGNFEMITNIYSNNAVSIGELWNTETAIEAAFQATLVTKFKYAETNPAYRTITGEGKLKTLDKDANVPVNGMPAKYNLSGTMTHQIKVDKTTGWIIEATTKQEFQGSCEIKDNPNLPGGLTIPMSAVNTGSFKGK